MLSILAKITLGTNLSAMRTSSSLRKHTQDLSSVYQQLSSGMRINKASDDAAGLAISMNLAKEGKVQTRASLNISDGLSVSSIMEGALTELIDITTRRMTLAEQAANGVYSDVQRMALDDEFRALDKEFSRILGSTDFNNRNLFYEDNGRLVIDAGYSQIILDLGDLGGINFIQDSAEPSADSTNVGFSVMRFYGAAGECGMTAQVATGVNGNGKTFIVATDYGTADQCSCVGGYSNDVFSYIGIGEDKVQENGTTDVGTESRPYYVELSDGNGDGKTDFMITATLQTADVHVSTVGADGSISNTQVVGDYRTITSMTVGDVNGDGKDDIIVVGRENGNNRYNVYQQLGNGDGTFQEHGSPIKSNVGSGVFSVAAVNADGSTEDHHSKETIVYGSRSGDTGKVMTTNGNTIYSGSAVYDIATGDIDGDGKEDIAVAAGNYVRVFTSNGNGTFSEAYSVDLGGKVSGLDIGDINGDGKMDIAAVQSNDNRVHTIFNTTDTENSGNFEMTYGDSFRTGSGPTDIKLADVDGDGRDDAVIANALDGTIGIALAGKKTLRIHTQADAQFSLDRLNTTLTDINQALAAIGAFESRLETAFNVAKASEENYAAANSRIMDIDVAEKSAELTRKSILQDICSSVLAQANQQPERALALLQDVKIRNKNH